MQPQVRDSHIILAPKLLRVCDYQAPGRDGSGPNLTRYLVADGSQCSYSKLGMCKKLMLRAET